MAFTFATISMDWNVSKVRFRHPDTEKVVVMTTAELDADTTLRDAILTKALTATPTSSTHKDNYTLSIGVVQAEGGGDYAGTGNPGYEVTTIYQSLCKAGA